MPNISFARLQELEVAKKKLEFFQVKQELKPFVEEMLNGMGIILAITPFNKWPELAKASFDFYSKQYPVPSRIYKESLPKE